MSAQRPWLSSLLLAAVLAVAGSEPAVSQNTSNLRANMRNNTAILRENTRAALVPLLKIRRNAAGPVEAMAVDSDWRRMAIVLRDGDVRVWNLESGAVEAGLRPPSGPARRALLADGGRRIVLVDAAGGASVAAFPVQGPARPLAVTRPLADAPAVLSADGRTLFLAEADGGVGVWDLERATRSGTLPGRGAPVTLLALSPDGSILAGSTADGRFATWAVGGGTPSRQWDGGGAVSSLTVTGGGFAAGFRDGRIAAFGPDGSPRGVWKAHDGAVAGLTWSAPQGGLVSGGEDGAVKRWRLSDGSLAGVLAEPGRVRVSSLLVTPAGDRVLTASAEGTVLIRDAADGREQARLITTRDGWLAIDPAGRFDGTESTFQDVIWDAGGTALAVENFSSASYAPGVAPLALRVRPLPEPPVAVAMPVDKGIVLPPRVELAIAAGPAPQPDQTVEVRVEAIGQSGSGFEGIRLFHNGKRVPETARSNREGPGSASAPRWVETYRVALATGANDFRAVALGGGRIESDPATARVEVKAPKPAPNLYITAAGINRYDIPETRALKQAVNDAKLVASLFGDRSRSAYGTVDTRLILDQEASRNAVMDGIRRLSGSKKDDVVIVFLSGHGKTAGGDWHFMPIETRSLADETHVRQVGISATQIRDVLVSAPSQRIVLLIDACQSGAVLNRFEDFAQRRMLHGLSRETGVFALAASKADQNAPEYEGLGHGLFTYAMKLAFEVENKRMNADQFPPDNQVTVSELKQYVEQAVPALAQLIAEKRRKKEMQDGQARGNLVDEAPLTPTGVALGRDFPLLRR